MHFLSENPVVRLYAQYEFKLIIHVRVSGRQNTVRSESGFGDSDNWARGRLRAACGPWVMLTCLMPPLVENNVHVRVSPKCFIAMLTCDNRFVAVLFVDALQRMVRIAQEGLFALFEVLSSSRMDLTSVQARRQNRSRRWRM